MFFILKKGPGGLLNIKMSSYQYRDPHVKDQMVLFVLSLTWESPYLGKTVFMLSQSPGHKSHSKLTLLSFIFPQLFGNLDSDAEAGPLLHAPFATLGTLGEQVATIATETEHLVGVARLTLLVTMGTLAFYGCD